MNWVTREHPRADRIACPWLIRKFIDREAPQSRGLEAIAEGFALLNLDDQRQLELELPVYDALYAWAQHEVTTG